MGRPDPAREHARQRGRGEDEHLEIGRRRGVGFGLFALVAAVGLYFLLPRLAGLEETWSRIEDGEPGWLGLAFVFAVGSFLGYVGLFQGVYAAAGTPLSWRESYQITMAGLAATRLFSAGGAGGIVLTAWAMRRAGMGRREVADRTIAFLTLMYGVYVLALIVGGVGLRTGVLAGPNPFALTVVPAGFGVAAIAVAGLVSLVPTNLERRLERFAGRQGRVGRWAQGAAKVPASAAAGLRLALGHLRSRDPALLGAIAYWAFQIAVLWAAFRAFSPDAPPAGVLVVAFFVGMLGNLLPLPGGIGGVDGGMIGALLAFGVDGGLAVVAVLVYRAFTFWLPTLPGVLAYLQLRRTVERWRAEPRRV